MNVISSIHVRRNDDVFVKSEDWLFMQPDVPKDKLGLFNYWSEKKRSSVSDNATMAKLVLDFDDGATRAEIEDRFAGLDYIIYNSTGNQASKGIEKFRIIITLKEPVLASDLKYWRRSASFKQFVAGVDESSFAIGRFFYRPSKFDKDRAPVTVLCMPGEPLDFYERWPHHQIFQPWEDLKAQLLAAKSKPVTEKRADIFNAWVAKTYQAGTHYSDICAFCRRAYTCGLDAFEAEQIFAGIYAGHSKWQANFRKVYSTMR